MSRCGNPLAIDFASCETIQACRNQEHGDGDRTRYDVCHALQIREAGKLEAVGGLDLISLNALTAVLASADRLGEAEETLQKAKALAASKGVFPFEVAGKLGLAAVGLVKLCCHARPSKTSMRQRRFGGL